MPHRPAATALNLRPMSCGTRCGAGWRPGAQNPSNATIERPSGFRNFDHVPSQSVAVDHLTRHETLAWPRHGIGGSWTTRTSAGAPLGSNTNAFTWSGTPTALAAARPSASDRLALGRSRRRGTYDAATHSATDDDAGNRELINRQRLPHQQDSAERAVFDQMAKRFGGLVELVRSLDDRLHPSRGQQGQNGGPRGGFDRMRLRE